VARYYKKIVKYGKPTLKKKTVVAPAGKQRSLLGSG
jgi:hypothetical protein